MKYSPAQSSHFQRAVPLPTGALCLLAIQPSSLLVEPFISGKSGNVPDMDFPTGEGGKNPNPLA